MKHHSLLALIEPSLAHIAYFHEIQIVGNELTITSEKPMFSEICEYFGHRPVVYGSPERRKFFMHVMISSLNLSRGKGQMWSGDLFSRILARTK